MQESIYISKMMDPKYFTLEDYYNPNIKWYFRTSRDLKDLLDFSSLTIKDGLNICQLIEEKYGKNDLIEAEYHKLCNFFQFTKEFFNNSSNSIQEKDLIKIEENSIKNTIILEVITKLILRSTNILSCHQIKAENDNQIWMQALVLLI